MEKYPTVSDAVEKLVDSAYEAIVSDVFWRDNQDGCRMMNEVSLLLTPNSHRIEEQVGQDLGISYDEAIF